jgi:hypothetical protein
MISETFYKYVPELALKQSRESVGSRLIGEYGAIFAAGGGAVPPDRLIFRDESAVAQFQQTVDIGTIVFGEITIELQAAASEALKQAADEAANAKLSISPRSADSGRRNYQITVDLWKSRVEPALDHWQKLGSIDASDAARIRSLEPFDQVEPVFALEDQGIFFAKDLSKSIIYSVAPPGASQHLSMLAFDVAEFNDENVRRILASHGWYQTVPSDLPHFTYLGLSESELIDRGIKKINCNDRPFWVPDI